MAKAKRKLPLVQTVRVGMDNSVRCWNAHWHELAELRTTLDRSLGAKNAELRAIEKRLAPGAKIFAHTPNARTHGVECSSMKEAMKLLRVDW